MKKLFSALLDGIFPRCCCICRQYLFSSNYRYLCDQCFGKIIFPSHNLCQKCAYDFGVEHSRGPKLCPRCLETNFHFRTLRSAVRLNAIAKKLILRFKYRNGEHLAADLCKIIQQNTDFMDFIGESVLVPVPLHWRRQFFREYNQSELLAKTLEKLPIHSRVLPLLKRIRYARPQVELHASERHNNMRNAFRINAKIKIPLHSKLIVFDDVLTTGSTINECAKVLQQHGFLNIYAATFTQTIKE
jgi:ComF family protein